MPRLLSWFVRGLSALLVAAAALLYFVHVPAHPPGFSIDESSICYNAWTISQTGHDEYGQAWPLFFRAFGEYKSPTIIYLLAALFRVTGPSIAAARILVASFGVVAALLLGWLAWRITRRWIVAAILAGAALLTPWLFESSRLVFEVALYPTSVALFLLAVWNASQIPKWDWRNILFIALTLAVLTYSYSIGRLLGPSLGLGLGLFLDRTRWPSVAKTWTLYALLCLPLLLFHAQNPEALTGRFKTLTYLTNDQPVFANLKEFARHYLANVNPSRWLFTGENNIRDHVEGTGSLLAASVLLAISGLVIVLLRHRRDPWWHFVLYGLLVSPVPASLTLNPFPQLRLIAFPVFFLVFSIPALEWLTKPPLSHAKGVALGTVIAIIAGQSWFFQRLYHAKAPGLWYVFDARFPKRVLEPALRFNRRPIYLLDEPGKAGYIHALWYGVLNHLHPATFVRLPWGQTPPPGALLISTEEQCHDCRLAARALNYIVYSIPPYATEPVAPKEPLRDFAAHIVCENPPSVMKAGAKQNFSFLVRNISLSEWPCVSDLDGSHAVKLHARWIRKDGPGGTASDVEKELPYDIEPGDTVGLTLPIAAPSEPGHYQLEVDLVQQGVARFSERGSRPYTCALEVGP